MLPDNAVGACVVVDVVAVDVVTGLLVISRIDYSIVINYIVPNRIGGVVVYIHFVLHTMNECIRYVLLVVNIVYCLCEVAQNNIIRN
jgi:hypothetical protein